jgi:hypothetical protein
MLPSRTSPPPPWATPIEVMTGDGNERIAGWTGRSPRSSRTTRGTTVARCPAADGATRARPVAHQRRHTVSRHECPGKCQNVSGRRTRLERSLQGRARSSNHGAADRRRRRAARPARRRVLNGPRSGAKKAARRRFRTGGPKKPAITYSRPIRTTIGRVGLTTEFGMGSGVSPHVWSPATRVREANPESRTANSETNSAPLSPFAIRYSEFTCGCTHE